MKMQKTLAVLSAAVLYLGTVTAADAALLTRLGGLAFYDTDQDITWLADANAGLGSAFDDGFSSTDGMMTQLAASNWAASLNINGVTGWRLPTTLQPDPSCSDQSGGASSDFNCSGSEMGHLFYSEGVTYATPGVFSNVQIDAYWSADLFAVPGPTAAWRFSFYDGRQLGEPEDNNLYAWAVHSGDVGTIPVPAAVWLFGSGLIGLIGLARRKA